MQNILFVDDQPQVLRGLRRTLDCMEEEWDMEFVGSGQEALDIMAQKPFDVVVSDMHMPGMDGAQLLAQLSHNHPNTVRIVLSGQENEEAVFRAVGPMHQYLSKPCDAQILQDTIQRALAMQELLAEPSLRQLVSQLSSLPSLPSLYEELVKELESPDGSVQQVGKIVAQDLGMTVKTMQLVNSAMFGLRQPVSAPEQAVAVLGMDTVKALALSIGVFSQFNETKLNGFSIDALLNHSLAVGTYARTIAKTEQIDKTTENHAFTAGLLHDAGKLMLVSHSPERYEQSYQLATEKGIPRWQAERETFGADHADVGAYLLGLWGLPQPIVQAVAFHHKPEQCPNQSVSPCMLVHVANVFEHEKNASHQGCEHFGLAEDYLERAGLAGRLPTWRELGKTEEEVKS